MEEAGSNAFEVEIEPSPVVALYDETRTNLVKLPRPKVSQIRKGTMSTCIGKMILLD